jgi:hypothetical protein
MGTCNSNAGFDSLIILEDNISNLVFLLISSKFSEGDSKQEIGELFDTYDKSMKQLKDFWMNFLKILFILLLITGESTDNTLKFL